MSTRRAPVLTLNLATRAVAALAELHRVCLAMDAEQTGERPTEEEYQAAMTAAGDALTEWPNGALSRRPGAKE